MPDNISFDLMQSIVDSQQNLIVIFHNDEVILINKSFKKFVAVSSLKEYKEVFPKFLDHFVPHPSYFNAEKIKSGESWFDAVMKMQEIDRVVSLLTPDYEPHAFSVDINSDVDEYKIVTLTDITQTLIKRIMIDNHANMDINSGAYSKNYFLHIAQSYEDAATFNEKIIGAILIKVDSDNFSSDNMALSNFANHFKKITRQDDMLIRWSDNTFLLVYLVDTVDNSKHMLEKLDDITSKDAIGGVNYTFTLTTQKEKESIKELIKRVDI
ncbi:MAG: hypothetical protein OQK48_09080 [Sulfurimonas sp.]|nr:hypothetical protein [Sulfurimonas sp.]